MERPDPSNDHEQQERPIRFRVMPGTIDEDPQSLNFGFPVAYFVRSNRATGTYVHEDPIGESLCIMFGIEALDVFVGGDRSSDEARQEAEGLAAALNVPETIEQITTFLERQRHLEEAIRLVEADQQSRANAIGARIGLGEARTIKRYNLDS